ncbi:MAG: hypothetical protein KGM95_10340 [Betaproteobacteria bacterium]|nr:hypothetical protein [Betaproteobacteria bacterium]
MRLVEVYRRELRYISDLHAYGWNDAVHGLPWQSCTISALLTWLPKTTNTVGWTSSYLRTT